MLIDFCRKALKVKRTRLKLRGLKVFLAVARSYLSFSYILSSFLFRYYVFLFGFQSFFYPGAGWYVLFLFMLSGMADFLVNPPGINLVPFLLFYAMDRLAYQTGVLWGCIRERSLAPLLPSLGFKTPGG